MLLLHYEWEQDTDQGSAGWSENFWYIGSDLAGALTLWNSFAPYLAAVHSNEARLRGGSVRAVSDDPGVRIARLYTPVTYYDSGHFLSLRYEGMYPSTAVRISIYDSNGRSNDVWLKGMPDGIDVGGHLALLPIWQLKMNALLNFIKTPGSGFARRHLDFAQAVRPVTAVSTTGVVTCKGHGFSDNNVIRLGRTNSDPNIDGLYRVIAITGSADTFQLGHFRPLAAPAETTPASYAQRQLQVAVAATDAKMEGVTKKNVGRPRRGPRGRQTTPRR